MASQAIRFTGTFSLPPTPYRVETVAAVRAVRPELNPADRFCFRWWVLDYFYTSGTMFKIGVRGRWQIRPAGVVHLYAPDTPYWEDSTRISGPVDAAWVNFRITPPAILRRFCPVRSGFARFEDPGGVLGGLFTSIVAAAAPATACAHDVDPAVHAALRLLLQATPRGKNCFRIAPRSKDRIDLVTAVRQYLADHLADPINCATLARHAHVSVSTLTHRYREAAGETPMATLRRVRVARARELLLLGSSVKEAAVQTGFWDAAHFSRAFKQAVGSAPSAFGRERTDRP